MVTHSSILAWRIPCGQRSLVGYNPWGRKELNTTEHTHKVASRQHKPWDGVELMERKVFIYVFWLCWVFVAAKAFCSCFEQSTH